MKQYRNEIFSFLMLMAGVLLEYAQTSWFALPYVSLVWFLAAVAPVGLSVMAEAWEHLMKKEYFSEFMLMTIATIGAFCIGEYPEGVAVMLFYAVGEQLQDSAVDKARDNIRALLDMRPRTASVFRKGQYSIVSPEAVETGETIEVKVGEKVPLDGVLQNEVGVFNTAALTGESLPRSVRQSGEVLAGMIPVNETIRLNVTKPYSQSTLARMLEMVEEAAECKAPTELFMRKVARYYTPAVIGIAFLIPVLPFLYSLVQPSFIYLFASWLYRSLVFLVISCPCALVVSIPLGYFGGIGAASHKGILFKGGNYLDAVTKADTFVFDKTGTLTTGNFRVCRIETAGIYSEAEVLKYIASAESKSSHPMAKAVVEYAKQQQATLYPVGAVTEIAGYGLEAYIGGKQILAGNYRLMDKYGIAYPEGLHEMPESLILCACNGIYAGVVVMEDELKDDAVEAIRGLKQQGIRHFEILSGDKTALVQNIAHRLDIRHAYGDLLPADKVARLQKLKDEKHCVAFVGDGINDAPVLALSDVGIAMGGLGSDIAIETADVIIQDDSLSKLVTAVRIGKYTRRIIWQNIILAFLVKFAILALGTVGVATLWEAVFADSGVALLAIFNAMRINRLIKHS
ncbi:heavy metal translocating P-type ATPase [Phocaeicola massiliensis]|uniref:heavy metal translocating P-type ATPase n=1 Tax=Phocaeicola massiliensis TaxID=204516 RepID=UPI001898B1CE|nr:heavy metal translocating P-type ATPase [Phocaeicola massiliensis]